MFDARRLSSAIRGRWHRRIHGCPRRVSSSLSCEPCSLIPAGYLPYPLQRISQIRGPNVTAETGEIFRAVGGVWQGRYHQRRARRAEEASFSVLVSNSIFECHVCAKGGSGSLTGPCSVGKETARGVQNQGQGYHGVAGQHVLVQVQPGPGSRSPPGSVASRCWTVFSLRVRGTRIADIASDTPQIWGSPWVDDESKRPGAPVLSSFVFLDRTGFEVIGFCGMRDYDGEKIYPKASRPQSRVRCGCSRGGSRRSGGFLSQSWYNNVTHTKDRGRNYFPFLDGRNV